MKYYLECSSNHKPVRVEVNLKVYRFVKKHNDMSSIKALKKAR